MTLVREGNYHRCVLEKKWLNMRQEPTPMSRNYGGTEFISSALHPRIDGSLGWSPLLHSRHCLETSIDQWFGCTVKMHNYIWPWSCDRAYCLTQISSIKPKTVFFVDLFRFHWRSLCLVKWYLIGFCQCELPRWNI